MKDAFSKVDKMIGRGFVPIGNTRFHGMEFVLHWTLDCMLLLKTKTNGLRGLLKMKLHHEFMTQKTAVL